MSQGAEQTEPNGPPQGSTHRLAPIRRLVDFPRPKPWVAYTSALIAMALATAVHWWLGSLVGQRVPPFITFYPLILFTALFGGIGPGVVATLLASLTASYLFLEPTGSLRATYPADQVSLALFIAINIMVSLVCGALRSARHGTFAAARRADDFEERFRLFMENTPTLVWIKDDEGHYTYLNKAYEQRFGRTLAECQGKTDADLWPAEVAARLQKVDQAVLAGGHHIEVTEETVDPSGAVSFWLNTKFPVRVATGRQFIASIGVDVTDRKRSQEAMQESEARLRLAVETAELGMYERDLMTNQVTLNAACQAIFGVTGPFTPDVARRSVHPEDRARVLSEAARAFDLNQRAICGAEFRILRPDGTTRWVAGRGRVLFDDQQHPARPVKFIGVLNDITDRKNYEDALRGSRASLAQAIRVARLGTFDSDLASESIAFSVEARQMFGLAPNEQITISGILERIPTPYREQVAAAIEAAHDPAGEGLFETEHPMVGADGESRWLSVRAQTFFEGEGPDRHAVRTIGAILDITDQKDHAAALTRLVQERTAQLEETVAELEHFSYTITHDMRAPLRAMTGYAGIVDSLQGQSLSDEGRDLLRRISESALRMDQLITDALQFSRVVRDRFPLQPLDPAASIRGIVKSYPQFRPPHSEIVVQPEIPRVLANEAALTQIFSNLLGNAVKFVTPGQVPRISVSGEVREGFVRVCISDNGVGIPPEYHGKIWQMFQRLDKSYEGTGIGLALVRKAAERMGGRVGVESSPGQGSRFWVELQKAP